MCKMNRLGGIIVRMQTETAVSEAIDAVARAALIVCVSVQKEINELDYDPLSGFLSCLSIDSQQKLIKFVISI